MPTYAVTVLGLDRPGIVARVTQAIAELGGNLEDSSMTLLRGHFAMTLIAELNSPGGALQQRLKSLSAAGLVVSVIELPTAPDVEVASSAFLLSVHGADRPGIVSAVTRRLADLGGNITDLSTRLAGGFYVLTAEVRLPQQRVAEALAELRAVAASLGVTVHLTPVDEDVM
jgi:glycine cleavage system transcriptional repressor